MAQEIDIPPKERTMLMLLMYNILFMNDTAMSYVYSTLELLKKTPLFKQQIKFKVAILEKYMKLYNASLEQRSQMSEFIADVNDMMYDRVCNDLMKLEFATKNILEKHRVPNSDMMTKLSIAVTLLDATCHNIDYATSQKYNGNIAYYARRFRPLNLKKIKEAFMQLANLIESENESLGYYVVDLSKYREIDNGFTIIVRKLKDVNLIWDVLQQVEKSRKNA